MWAIESLVDPMRARARRHLVDDTTDVSDDEDTPTERSKAWYPDDISGHPSGASPEA